MAETPRYTIRLPLPLKEAIHTVRGKKTMTAWIIEAIISKLKVKNSYYINYFKNHD